MDKLLALTGIRAYAAYGVVFFHMYMGHLINKADLGFLEPLVHKGFLGVDLFFILSGFIISYVYQHPFNQEKSGRYLDFYWLRVARIIPVHYFMLALYLIFLAYMTTVPGGPPQPERYQWMALPYHVLNIQAWGFTKELTWNIPAWSVSAEWFAYLLFPFLSPWISRTKRLWKNITCVIACIGLYHIAQWLLAEANYLNLIRVTLEFSAGCFTYNLFTAIQLSPKKADYGAGIVILSLLVGVLTLQLNDSILIGVFPLLIFFLAKAKGFISGLFSNKVACFLGEISFSLYMVHDFVGLVWPKGLAEEVWPVWYRVALRLTAVTMAAWILYVKVEVPARNKIRALAKAYAIK